MTLGLDRPIAGTVTIDGRPFHDQASPLREVGAKAIRGGRSAYNDLLCLAQSNWPSGVRTPQAGAFARQSPRLCGRGRLAGLPQGRGYEFLDVTVMVPDSPS
jgi:hypothetical protein